MGGTVPKPLVRTTKQRRMRDAGAIEAAPQLPSSKPTGTKPAPAASPVPVLPAPVPEAVAALPAPVVAAPLAEAPAPLTPPAAKEVIMETIENVTAKTQTVFNDATERAKGAVEKGQKMLEEANEFGKGNIEALVESSKIAARGFEAMTQEAATFAKKTFEEATAAAKTLSSVKSPTEFMKLQSDYARAAFDAMVQQTSRNTEAMLKLAGEVAQPLSNRAALAAEKIKVAA
jgi:phasin family protein